MNNWYNTPLTTVEKVIIIMICLTALAVIVASFRENRTKRCKYCRKFLRSLKRRDLNKIGDYRQCMMCGYRWNNPTRKQQPKLTIVKSNRHE